jgi:hypothetical protein
MYGITSTCSRPIRNGQESREIRGLKKQEDAQTPCTRATLTLTSQFGPRVVRWCPLHNLGDCSKVEGRGLFMTLGW